MRWNLRLKAAERGIWKSAEMRRLLADAGLDISHGKMSALWTGTPVSVRLQDLEAMCVVLDCTPSDLLIVEADQVTSASGDTADEQKTALASGKPTAPRPHLGRNRSVPPA